MSRHLVRILVLAGIALLVAATVALAAGPRKGATYTGTAVHGKESVTLKVSKSGRTVTVSVPFPPLYCEGGGAGTRQVTKPAAIAGNGTFKGSIAYEFIPLHKLVTKLYFSGRFSGKRVSGKVRSEFGLLSPEAHRSLLKCNGSTGFSAQAK